MARDPYKYFRIEARELLDSLTRGALEIEKGASDKDLIASLLRLAHTLKGASRVVRQLEIADLAHRVEGILSPFREAPAPLPAECARDVLQALDQAAARLEALDSPAESRARPAADELTESVRVDVEDVEAVMAGLSEAGVRLTAIEKEMDALVRAKRLASLVVRQFRAAGKDSSGNGKIRPLGDDLLRCLEHLERRVGADLEGLGRDLAQTHERANRLRLLPVAGIFPVLNRAVRDAASTLGRQVRFEPSGGDVRLDAHVIGSLRDALSQLVRNAVAHGIEDPAERAASGKPRSGRVELRVQARGRRIAFLCRDDGRGIDVAGVRRAAVKKGVISAAVADTLGLNEAIDLLLRGGVSTSVTADEISGRGIGLDIVREAVARLKGEISIDTAPGRGTTVEIVAPVSLTSVAALLVEANGSTAALPVDSVRRTLRLTASEIASAGPRQSILFEGRPIPFLPLSTALGGQPAAAPRRACWTTVVVASEAKLAALGVDRLLGTATVLLRSLPAFAAARRVVSGASLDSEGNPQLVLDPAGLVEAASASLPGPRAPEVSRAPILIIDDSLTTRMVEQSILESAGHAVDVAASGEEALEKAAARRYSLFLVDIEMPGMDGFEFISRAREHPLLRDVPAVLVTSRSSSQDRRRGEEAGASAYIVKSEFDQGQFLKIIEELSCEADSLVRPGRLDTEQAGPGSAAGEGAIRYR